MGWYRCHIFTDIPGITVVTKLGTSEIFTLDLSLIHIARDMHSVAATRISHHCMETLPLLKINFLIYRIMPSSTKKVDN